jgi:formylglycine-generating enzyme required for sulfatase activity
MATKVRCAFVPLVFVLGSALCAYTQLRPEVTVKPKPRKPPAAKVTPEPAEKPAAKPEQPQKPPEPEPAQISVETSPNAEVYLDDEFVGRASPQGRLVVGNPKAGDHGLRVSLTGKRDYEATVTVAAGQETRIEAPLEDLAAVKENPKDGLKYVWIPPGSFMMGCSPEDSECSQNEKPSYQVRLTKGFWMGQTEVTVGAYKRFASATGRAMPSAPGFNPGWSNEQMPIVMVTWDDSQAYCRWAGGRLPTETEWEYAARAGSTEARYEPLEDVAWYADNSGHRPHEVGQKRPNAWTLYDMLGNVWERLSDWYRWEKSNPEGPVPSGDRVLRGGSWYSAPGFVRVSYRLRSTPEVRNSDIGIRCVGEVAP